MKPPERASFKDAQREVLSGVHNEPQMLLHAGSRGRERLTTSKYTKTIYNDVYNHCQANIIRRQERYEDGCQAKTPEDEGLTLSEVVKSRLKVLVYAVTGWGRPMRCSA